MANNTLYGVHLDSPSNTQVVIAGFAGWLSNAGVKANQIRALYGSANWKTRYSGKKESAWKAEMKSIANAIGYHGKVRGFDTRILVSNVSGNAQTKDGRTKDSGAYIEYRPVYGKSKCNIFYKKNWKMDYNESVAIGNTRSDFAEYNSTAKGFRAQNTFFKTTLAATLSSHSSADDLHEVDYFLRQVSFDH